MKQLLIIILTHFLTASSFSQDANKNTVGSKTIILNQPVTNLVINNGLSVVLLEDETAEVFIEGMQAEIESILLENYDGQLTISSNTGTIKKPVVLYISAKYLKNIVINGNSIAGSYTTLQNKKLEVVINGECKLSVRTIGTINIESTEEYEFISSSKPIKK